jgi:hypothetical protein
MSDRGRRRGVVLPTLLAAVASGGAVLVTVLTAGVAVRPHAGPELPAIPAVPVVRPPEAVDGPPLAAPTP